MPSKFKRKPPSMDGIMNNIKSISKKVEHIKGFKFEIAPALSTNFHLSSSWVSPPSVAAAPQEQPQNPGK